MKYDERLIGRKPSDEFIARSRTRLDEMFKRRIEHRQALRRAREPIEAASFEVMRSLAGNDAASPLQ